MISQLKDWPFRTHAFELPLRYLDFGAGPGVVLCLHGYQDHAAAMLRRLSWLTQPDLPFRVVAVNAPFPVPIWTADGFTEAYAWYFRDATSGFEVSTPAAAARGLAALIEHLNLNDVPKVLFGFSQGAYLAPHVAKALRNVRAIVGAGGGFPPESYDGLDDLHVHAIHGDADERVSIDRTRAEHAELIARGFKGEFRTVPGLRHRVDQRVEAIVRGLARAAFD